jgi:zinc transport system substrate-binding protein
MPRPSMTRTLLIALAVLASGAAAAEPRVAASIQPLHSLAANVMAGIGTPALLVPGAASPHSYALRPSEARLINDAEIVFWLGPTYETFLAKTIEAAGAKKTATPLMRAPGVTLLTARKGGTWDGDDHNHGHSHAAKPAARAEEIDPHVFLDPGNAQAIVRAMAATLAATDPANRERYAANATATITKLETLDGELRNKLAPVQRTPYVVFHDGYQYFEQRYRLNAVGSVTVNPDRPPGARRLREIRSRIAALGATCVFAEPQFKSALVTSATEGTKARVGSLDYLGVGIAPGPEAYFETLRGLARSLADCLAN